MSLRHTSCLAAVLALLGGTTSGQHIVPSALLTIDQNRSTVVERIVGEWGDRLTASNAGINSAQLREILSGLRSDHLLAASLAGNMEGLRNVVAGALVHTDAAVAPGRMHAKALGDTGDDLVYTPIVPCRILDTRNGTTPPYNAQMVGGSAFPVAANLANFAPQGGSATNCNLPASFAAIAMTLTVLNPNFDAFMAASSSSNFATLTQSVVMDFSANKGLANTAIVPVDGMVKFYLGLPAQVTTHVIADAVGYLRRPSNYGGTHTITGAYATDSGGFDNTAGGNYATVGGGNSNTASGLLATIGGGVSNFASASFSTASGGSGNTARAEYTTVGGGLDNLAADVYSTVAGGKQNEAIGYASAVGGGDTNSSSGLNATIAGGGFNIASGNFSAVAGGTSNNANGLVGTIGGGSSNTASGNLGTIAGGTMNTASGAKSAVGGGTSNTASGLASSIPGGSYNTAFGANSFAAGFHANANYDGCFVWGDNSPSSEVRCDEQNRFVVRSLGGIFMLTGGSTQATYIGAVLPPGATAWITLSDRAGKDNLRPVDTKAVLRKVAAMPIATWNWKSQDASIRHMGPTAQDFHAAFGLGETPKGISTVDADGVALAAIQGLHQVMQQKDAKLRIQDRKLHDQSNKISTMERELAAIKEKLDMR